MRAVNKTALIQVIFLWLLLLSTSIFSLAQGQDSSKYFVLDNGLKVFLLEKHTLPLVNIVAAVNLGSKDETEDTSGLAHLLEHAILYRGTEFRSSSEIGQDIRCHGAFFNARTGEDFSIFEISLPTEYADFALENQKEILFNSKLSQKALDQEKEVVLEEISQVQDDPEKYATSLVFQNLFRGHPYQSPIYGTREAVKAATVEKLEAFYKRYFVPANCTLALVGDLNLKDMREKVKNTFGKIKSEAFTPSKFDKVTPLEKSVDLVEEMDVKEGYLVIGLNGPDYNHPDQYAINILTEIIGRGINPLLNSVLRGRMDLIQTIRMSYNAQLYGGIILIYLRGDPKNLNAAKREATSFLKKLRNENFSKEDFPGEERIFAFDFLESAKNQIKFNAEQSQEKGLTLAAMLAQYLLLHGDFTSENYLENIMRISSSDLRKIAAKYFSKGEYVTVSIVPQKKS
jgi:predicted Zn-dependent peptidase